MPTYGPSSSSSVGEVKRYRNLTALAVGSTLILGIGSGFVFAKKFESPAQREASATPPAARPIFSVVSRGTLEDSVAAQGVVGSERQLALSPLEPVGRAVITKTMTSPGHAVRPFEAVVEINGRPLFALSGAFAYYRPLVAGSNGPDVIQLQANLRAAGQTIPESERGRFGPSTAAAVMSAYARAGYTTVAGPVSVPLTEIAYVASLPATVTQAAGVGAAVDGEHPAVQAGTGRQVIRAEIANSDVVQLRQGQKANLIIGAHQYAATLLRFEGATGTDDQGQTETLFVPRLSLNGLSPRAKAQIDIPISVTATDALLVPDRAVAYDRDRQAWVLVADGNGLKRIQVKVLGSLAGQTALDDTPGLTVGTRVRVG
jgi:peptidoglycan hydrolase-like protein with peptidoglycan-binding domain